MQAVSSRPSLAAPALGAPPRAAPGAAAVAARLSGGRRPRGAPSARRLLLPRALERPPEARDDGRERGSFCPALAAALGVAAVSKIRWAHCVNSRRRLRRALLDERVHMLEVDVSFGELRAPSAAGPACGPAAARGTPAPLGGGSWGPVAAHFPTQRSSDLSVEELLRTVMQHNAGGGSPKGLKLDFKQLGCVRPVVAAVLDLHAQLSAARGPAAAAVLPPLLPAVFFNADVVRGSCLIPRITERLQDPLPLGEFVRDVASGLAPAQPGRVRCALSLGWTPGLPISSGCRLTDAMAEQMLAALPPVQAACDAGLLQHVTFGVSAACARDSAPTLSRIRAAVGDSVDTSVTFFTPTFGLGVTRDEARYLHRYPACPPVGGGPVGRRYLAVLRARPAVPGPAAEARLAGRAARAGQVPPQALQGVARVAAEEMAEDRGFVMEKAGVC